MYVRKGCVSKWKQNGRFGQRWQEVLISSKPWMKFFRDIFRQAKKNNGKGQPRNPDVSLFLSIWPPSRLLGLAVSSLGFLEVSQPGWGLIEPPPTLTFLLFIQNMWNLSQLISGISSTQLWYQFVTRSCDVMMTSPHLIFCSIFSYSRLLPMKSKENKHFWGIFW